MAEQALAEQRGKGRIEIAGLEEQRARLTAEIEQIRRQLEKTISKFEQRVTIERGKYESALERWRASGD